MWHPIFGLGNCAHMHPSSVPSLPCSIAGPDLWLAQGPPTPASPRTYGRFGHGYNPLSLGTMGQPTSSTSTSWFSDPCHVMWLIAGGAAAAASALTTYGLRKKKAKR